MTWLFFLVNLGACAGLVAVAVMRAKRIGGVAPWLIALVGAANAALFTLFRLFALLSDPSNPYEHYRNLATLDLFDGLAMYGLGVLVLVAFYTMMPPTRRA